MVKRKTKPEKGSSGSVRVSVSLDAGEHAELRRLAEENRVSLAWVVRDAVAMYLNHRPRAPRKNEGAGA